MSFINELFEKLVTQGAEETLGEVAYIGSVKVIGSAEDLASTLSSTAVLASAAKENMGVVGNSANRFSKSSSISRKFLFILSYFAMKQ